jgi:MbtH protein
MNDNAESQETWIVLVNAQGQHGLWPVVRPVPPGWREVGPEGDAETCLAWIRQRWTDQRPADAR